MAKIILSYRRADSAAMTQLIFTELARRYGKASLFMDIDDIPAGSDFRAEIHKTVIASDILLAVVGSAWIGVNSKGEPRIQEADDPVRVEVETALEHGITVIPVLIERATMPPAEQMPASLKNFPFLNAMPVDSGRDFTAHLERLNRIIDGILQARGKLPKRQAPPPAPLQRLMHLAVNPVSWSAVGGAVLPLLGAFLGLAPPWPRGAAFITAVVVFVVSIFVVNALRDAAAHVINRVMGCSAIAFALAACIYLAGVSLFTFQTPTTKEYWAKGFVCTAEALLVYKDKCPNLGIDELRAAEYEAERLWTSQSVTIVRVALVLMWLACFLAIAVLIGGALSHPSAVETRRTAPGLSDYPASLDG